MSKSRPPLIVIAGPTASGKSALALECAKAIGGSILNADASQLYSDIPILSAAPSKQERAAADHRLYAIRSGSEPFSAAEWASLARNEIAAIHAFGGTPILVGGTGLYLRTLIEGIAPVPPIDSQIRAEIRAAAVEENREALTNLDPDAAQRLGPADTTRIARALEVVRSTGRTLRDWQAMKAGGIGDDVALRPIVLTPPRDWIYARCDKRFTAMIDRGAAKEVEALLAKQLDPNLPVMRAIGVPEIAAFIHGIKDRDTMLSEGRQATRNYAKRQYTWFKHQPPPEWPRFSEPLDGPDAVTRALELLAAGR
jgi:tRNA dimethylallyltransferase